MLQKVFDDITKEKHAGLPMPSNDMTMTKEKNVPKLYTY